MKTFKQFQEAAISVPAIVGASKYIIPALMTGIGAAGTIKGGSKLLPKLMTGIGAAGTIMQSKKDKKEPSDAAAKRLENIRNNKLYRKSKNPKDPSYLEKLLRNLRKEEVAIANSMSGGGIAGSVEAGDEPPVNKKKKKKKKTYAYGGRGSRKMWMT